LATIQNHDAETVPIPSKSMVILDHARKPKTFAKGVLTSDIIILDLMHSSADLQEAEHIIKLLRQPLHQ